jgi:hypothetical protein
MLISILFVSLMAAGLLVGNELAVALFIHPVLYSVPDEAHARVAKPLAQRLGRYMPFWYAFSLVLAILQLIVTPTNPSWWLCCAAVSLLVLIIVLTLIFPVPINNRIAGLDLDRLPENWVGMRRLWDAYHRIRVLLLFVALTLLIVSALLDPRA